MLAPSNFATSSEDENISLIKAVFLNIYVFHSIEKTFLREHIIKVYLERITDELELLDDSNAVIELKYTAGRRDPERLLLSRRRLKSDNAGVRRHQGPKIRCHTMLMLRCVLQHTVSVEQNSQLFSLSFGKRNCMLPVTSVLRRKQR